MLSHTTLSSIRNTRQRAFTLIELLVVIAIIALLSSVVMVSLSTARAKSRDTARQAQVVEVKKAMNAYYAQHGRFPATVSGGASGPLYFAMSAYSSVLVPTYLPKIPVDPKCETGDCAFKMISSWPTNDGYAIKITWEDGSTCRTGTGFALTDQWYVGSPYCDF